MPNFNLKLRKGAVDSYREDAEITRADGFKALDVLESAKGHYYTVNNCGQLQWLGDKARGFVNLVEVESEPEGLVKVGRLYITL